MSSAPERPGSVHGLRTWRVVRDAEGELLAGLVHGPPWAPGTWVEATCAVGRGHPPPQPGCSCGLHALHPRPATARRVLGSRGEIPGVLEAAGRIEVHAEGLRAQRGRIHALVAGGGRNAALVERLGARYGVPVVAVGGPHELLAWCEERGLGLGEDEVAALLGPGPLREARVAVRRRALRMVAAIALVVALVAGGLALSSAVPHGKVVKGRSGTVTVR